MVSVLALLVVLFVSSAQRSSLRGAVITFNDAVDGVGQETEKRSLGEPTTAYSEASKGSRVPLIDDYADEDPDAPDIWDILIWAGAWIGRVARTIIVTFVKLCYALYTGITYGWEISKHDDAR